MRADRRRTRSISERASEYLRERTAPGRAATAFISELRGRAVPVHWTNLFGVITVASIAVLFVTGVMLMFVYVPSSEVVKYRGDFSPLVGVEVSRAFDSVMRLSFDIPGGLMLRQLHHWAALLVPASIMLQLLVSFFTGAFRRPRRGSWVALFLLLIAVLAGGWSGYALPDDALSGTGLRIVHGIVHSIPFVGTWIASFLFGGEFPSTIIENLNLIHVAVVPAALLLLIAIRARSAYRNRPPQFAAGGREEDNVVGIPILPRAAARSGGFFSIVVGVLVLMAAAVQISPVWAYGPADPGTVSAGSQPDWYTGFLDGALRLVPPGWEFVLFDRTFTLALLAPLVVIGAFLLIVAVYPFLEGWLSKDKTDHHILDRPRNTATRTGIGVAGMMFYGVLWLAASADVMALVFQLSFESVIVTLQVALIAGPVLAFMLTRRICLALQKKDRDLVLHGYETGRVVRLPGGEFVEVHQPLDEQERWRLAAHAHPEAIDARPSESGQLSLVERMRAALAAMFYADRVEKADSAGPGEDSPAALGVGTEENHRA
ncbi:cytochrome b N-terminal domain-containing protein [Microbacterium sp.]|uniref:cytochrome bc1 complex cytochrome b subunit n=1 Tax=Microbacterium sp. TaxID=51671 RepID=UPI00273280A9|nr:cytochrome b N-terminal domain-containing protein [Microbacterium sp.]MDP3951967.1 cytochrome b N-terminal domain-containing protein [Microbacterium sp.]